MTEREQALKIASMWLDFNMNALTQMVPGDPDCDACVVARQLVRATERVERLRAALRECGADWSSSSGTVMGAAAELGREFKRRMQVAGEALADT